MKQLIRVAIMWVMCSMAFAANLPRTPVAYATSGESLSVVANALEKTLGVPVLLQDLDANQKISGTFQAANGEAFLDQFAIKNGFIWDYRKGQVILASEGSSLRTPTKGKGAPSNFSKIVYDPKDDSKYGLMIFQVQNAQVEDRRVAASGAAAKVVPGVATLFRQFIGIQTPVAKAAPAPTATAPTGVPVPPTPVNASAQSLMSLFIKGADGPSADPLSADPNSRGVYADVRLNAVLVRDKISLFESYKGIIALLDRPADMVQLEAFIVDIQKDKVQNLGVNLGLGGDLSTSLILERFSGRRMLSAIKAMETNGQAETLSVPSVVSMNNEQALFSSRQNFFISVEGSYNATVNQITAETQLLVTPQIANEAPDVPFDERRVKLIVNIQDASANAATQKSETNLLIAKSSTVNMPSTTENQINTQAVVRSGDTLVIGGQVVRKKLNSTSGLPGTSGPGLLNRLFSSSTDEFHDYVRVYIVRPKILGEDSASANIITQDSPARQLANEKVQ